MLWVAVYLPRYPVQNVKVTLVDGSYHEVDSSELAFKIAASMAFKEACRKADPVLMEPIMKVDIIVPDDYLGDVIGDLNARRGNIEKLEAREGNHALTAYVPSEMFGYATEWVPKLKAEDYLQCSQTILQRYLKNLQKN